MVNNLERDERTAHDRDGRWPQERREEHERRPCVPERDGRTEYAQLQRPMRAIWVLRLLLTTSGSLLVQSQWNANYTAGLEHARAHGDISERDERDDGERTRAREPLAREERQVEHKHTLYLEDHQHVVRGELVHVRQEDGHRAGGHRVLRVGPPEKRVRTTGPCPQAPASASPEQRGHAGTEEEDPEVFEEHSSQFAPRHQHII